MSEKLVIDIAPEKLEEIKLAAWIYGKSLEDLVKDAVEEVVKPLRDKESKSIAARRGMCDGKEVVILSETTFVGNPYYVIVSDGSLMRIPVSQVTLLEG